MEDMIYWKKYNPKIAEKISSLLENILETPFIGLGRPEPLKHEFQGCWSRRITDEDRLVYKVEKNTITIFSCKYHYTKH